MTDVAVRELWRGRVWRIFPLRLVERRADGSALLWSPPGSDVRRPFADGVELRIPGDRDWTLESRPSRWEEVAVVVPGSRHTLWHFFEPDGSLRNWYVNFERETRWNGACFDAIDEKLDLVVAPDGTVTWKDEDELEAAPHVDTAELRALAEAVIADAPWPSGLEHFRADPDWPNPELPPAWDVAPLETERLRLAPLTAALAPAYAEIVGEAAAPVIADSERRWHSDGFGGWAIHDDRGFAGAIELRATSQPAEVEIGWALAPDRRGHGLATEAARAAIADAWTRTGAERVVAFVEPDNAPSHRLAERLGFRPDTGSGGYRLDRPAR